MLFFMEIITYGKITIMVGTFLFNNKVERFTSF